MEISAFPWFDPEPPSDTVALRNVFLHVTKACNLRCDYCYFSASRALPDEITTEDFERLWPDL
jgi:MoaA/NifB/PqqE/SkfB family radical SAM enzyme